MEEEEDHKELQLLPSPHSIASSSRYLHHQFEGAAAAAAPSLDLQLSISVRPIHNHHHHHQIEPPLYDYDGDHGDVNNNNNNNNNNNKKSDTRSCVEALKWQAAEQIRLAAIEKAYAERVRELTKREMELAQSEFTRARQLWDIARAELRKAERLKEIATTTQIDSTCMEITCHSCTQKFRPLN